jgi:outer membrane protein
MKINTILLALGLCAAATGAFAQKAGSMSLEVGFTHLSPQVTSGDLSPPAFPNTKADVSSANGLTGAFNYMINENIALNVPLGLGFKHDITGAARAQGFGKLASVRALPITVLGQYRFGQGNDKIRPYLGGGIAFVKFYKETGSAALTALTNPGGTPVTLSVETKIAPVIQLGMIYNFNEKWFLNAHYSKTFVTADTTFSTGQTQSIKLDPNTFSLAVGFKF